MAVETLLVTGATGLVGSNLCLAATRSGYRVRALVRNQTGTEPLQRDGIETVVGDITDFDSLLRVAAGAQGIIHTLPLSPASVPRSTRACTRPVSTPRW